MAFNWDDWEFTREKDHPGPHPWWMDRRHTEAIYALLMTGLFHRVLEIGCHNGSSSAALICAVNDCPVPIDLHLCDPDDNPIIRHVVESRQKPIIRHVADSLRIIPNRRWDLVIVDGDHTLQHVSRELGLLLYHETPTIIAHDTATRGWGDNLAGAVMLGDVLRVHPAYQTIEDAELREGEVTERGLMLATCRADVIGAARDIWRRFIFSPFPLSPLPSPTPPYESTLAPPPCDPRPR